ncbi:MAG: hypothetical protein UV43_C0016G0015 [Parcubacteria group bacterium GW2011_GWF2_42_7]|nr:MAG: hypothetical protein UU01_C0014G0004 [Parcubacteria group bacterium GW2011_GWA2_40_37]KKS11701.1 MAG: hypothetical protein UU66_C0011G0002 [Parcubacteria group bacterium GW2011_GWB1_41_5]KKS72511.1 MAG: hypothetical protein UV43_C0016G0015 [Parcubacteria group bacterium GW2011_GWF2_42_7]
MEQLPNLTNKQENPNKLLEGLKKKQKKQWKISEKRYKK